jgi:two-component system, response regulator PdtaR
MKNIKILIVEDEAIIALDMQETLTRLGYQVCGIASSGEKAVHLAETTSPNIIIMDMKLKGKMDGIETANLIKEKLSVPSVFLTASTDDNTIRQIENSLNKEYITKPFNEEELVSKIENLFNNPSAG